MAPCRANAQQPKLFVGMILILIFAEALALYGLIGEHIAGPGRRWHCTGGSSSGGGGSSRSFNELKLCQGSTCTGAGPQLGRGPWCAI